MIPKKQKQFLSYYSLKQGLKLEPEIEAKETEKIFILLSIKTRIETYYSNIYIYITEFLSYYPLKQGLKQEWQVAQLDAFLQIFILLSIKTRIETSI